MDADNDQLKVDSNFWPFGCLARHVPPGARAGHHGEISVPRSLVNYLSSGWLVRQVCRRTKALPQESATNGAPAVQAGICQCIGVALRVAVAPHNVGTRPMTTARDGRWSAESWRWDEWWVRAEANGILRLRWVNRSRLWRFGPQRWSLAIA